MFKKKIYLDTSVINFLFADDAPEKQSATIDFFENYVRKNVYQVFISQVVVDEINKTQNKTKLLQLFSVLKDFNLPLCNISHRFNLIASLAERYILNNIVPRNKPEDALHIAIATYEEMDILLSWNFRHLANINVESKVLSINIAEGFSKPLKMTTPLEVIYDNDNY